jgi:DNA-binding transcriptional regulator GbsR (MarR family)
VSEAELRPTAAADWRCRFVEDMCNLELVHAAPRGVMRVLGWMMVCQPDVQTAPAIQEALGLSAGTVSVALRTLVDVGLLERVERPGERRVYHRISAHGWERVLEARFQALTEMREVADRALAASGGKADTRLVEMRNTLAALEIGVPKLLRESRNDPADRPAPARDLGP